MLHWLGGLLGAWHVRSWNKRHPVPLALVGHVHYWDWCRQYGFLRYRICLNGCGQKKAC